MTVDSQPGRGTTVTVVLPVAGDRTGARPARPQPHASQDTASRADAP